MSNEEEVCDIQDNLSISSTSPRSLGDSDHDTSSTVSSKASIGNQKSEPYFSFDEPSSSMNLYPKPYSIINIPTINENDDKPGENDFGNINNKPPMTPTSSKIINDRGDNKKKTVLTLLSCRNQKPEFFYSFDDESSLVDTRFQSPTKINQNLTLKQTIDKLQNIDIITGQGAFCTQTLQEKTSNQQVKVYRTDLSMEGQETIDFLNQFTENVNNNLILEKIFSYLSYKDIASMIFVSNIWQKAIVNSTVAQKEMENVFIQGLLYFCHANFNVSEEYKCLFERILFDLKKHLQFNKQEPLAGDFSEK